MPNSNLSDNFDLFIDDDNGTFAAAVDSVISITPIVPTSKQDKLSTHSSHSSRQCTAHARNGSGKRCGKLAIKGSNVCASHGGAAPQVKKAAKERLMELVEPALEGLHIALKSGEIPSIVKAAQIVLDRTGFHPSQAIELTGKNGSPIQVQQATIDVNSLPIEIREFLLREIKEERVSSTMPIRSPTPIDDEDL